MQPHANPNPTAFASASQASTTTHAPEAPTDPTNAPHGAAWNTKGLVLDATPDPEATLTCEPLLEDAGGEADADEADDAPPACSSVLELGHDDAAAEHALRNVIDRMLWPALLWLIALGAVGSCVSAVLGCLVTCVRYDLPVPLAAKVVGGLCAPTIAVLYFLADRFAARVSR